MDVKIEKVAQNEVKLEVKVPAAEFEKGIEKAYHKNIQKFNVPGFRKGKAPRAIIEQNYGKGIFYEDAVNILIDATYPQAIEDNNIEPVDRPEIEVTDVGSGKDFIYTAKVTVKPDVELAEYKGLEVKKQEFPVTDEDIDKELENLREKNARIITKEQGTAAEKGDIVIIDFEGFMDGKPFENGKEENFQLELGSGSFIEGFEEQLVGKKAGDEVDVNVTFPEDYRAKDLAGKPALFKVKVNEVKYKELLPLDDEFAKDVSEFDTLEEFKKDMRTKMQESNDLRSKRQFEDDVVKGAVDNAKIDIPDVMVEREIDYIMEDLNYRLRYQGMDLERYAKLMDTTVEDLRKQYHTIGLERVKTQLVLQKIAEVENITAEEKEIDDEIDKMSKQYGKNPEQFKESLKERERNIIKGDIINSKTIDFIVKNAKVSA